MIPENWIPSTMDAMDATDWLIVILFSFESIKSLGKGSVITGKSDETRCEFKEKTAGMLMSNAMTSDCNLDSS
jgi:hypothetical protein